MKKLLIIMTLFMSSFFLFCNKEVKAYEYNVELDFSIINDTYYNLKEQIEEFIKTDEVFSDSYIIRYHNSSYQVLLFNKNFSNVFMTYSNNGNQLAYYNQYCGLCSFSNNILSCPSSAASARFTIYDSTKTVPFSFMIYSNFDIPILNNITFNYSYDNFTYVDSMATTNKFTNLVDLHVEYQKFSGTYVEPVNPHDEELEKVESFYIMVIEKLGYLSETIANNYIYLSIIVIFILTFIFLLIFRRFL